MPPRISTKSDKTCAEIVYVAIYWLLTTPCNIFSEIRSINAKVHTRIETLEGYYLHIKTPIFIHIAPYLYLHSHATCDNIIISSNSKSSIKSNKPAVVVVFVLSFFPYVKLQLQEAFALPTKYYSEKDDDTNRK